MSQVDDSAQLQLLEEREVEWIRLAASIEIVLDLMVCTWMRLCVRVSQR